MISEVGRLQDDAVGATRSDAIQCRHQVLYCAGLAEAEPRPHGGWSQRGQLGLEGIADAEENRSGGLHHDVDHETRPVSRSCVRCRSRSVMACCTSRTVLGRTPPRLLSTRSTVRSLRPACTAISRMRCGWPHGDSWWFLAGFWH